MNIKRLVHFFLVGLIVTAAFFLLGAARYTAASGQSIDRQSAVFRSGSDQTSWWNTGWDYRVRLAVNPGAFPRTDKPGEATLNFTQLLDSLGKSGALDLNSLRVIEVDAGDNVLDAAVPFQFDTAAGYNASTNAVGTLTWLLKGNTPANSTRFYHVYFDVTGKGFSPAPVTALVTTTDNVAHKGYQSIRLVTPNGEYFYHKPGGGFATLLDAGSNDWISWNSSTTPSGAAGDFRGIPNMVFPSDGGYFHPGRDTATTTLISQGPLKATFRSTNSVDPNKGQWEVVWEVFPNYARMTVTKAPALAYWFLYEGTPGGVLDVNKDFLTRSDGTTIPASGTWTTDIPNEEWLFVSDPDVNRSIYLVHHIDDTHPDSYYAMDKLMTVFGFGRQSTKRYLTGTGRQFTIGLVNSTAYNTVKPVVYNAWKDLTLTVGNAETQESEPPTATPVTPEPPTATPVTPEPPTATPVTPEPPTATPVTPEPPTATPVTPEPPPAFRLMLPFIIK